MKGDIDPVRVHFCLEGLSVISHEQDFDDITPLIMMKEDNSSIKFFVDDPNGIHLEGVIKRTALETVLKVGGGLKEQCLCVYIDVENKNQAKQYLKTILPI
jgi:hypothetical protein